MPVGVPCHQNAYLHPLRVRRQCGERGPRLQAGTAGIGEDGKEVVEDPGRVKTQNLAELPDPLEVPPAGELRRGLDSEPERAVRHHPSPR